MATKNKMNSNLISTYIFKLIGSISLIHAMIGIVLIIFSIFTFSDFEDPGFTIALNEQAIDSNDKETNKALSSLPNIVKSNEFKIFYWSITSFGFITNILLFYFGYHLIKAKAKYKYALAYIALMGITYVFVHEAPALIIQHESYMLSFGAAWGIGNMGISLMLYTHFWLWGPALALIGIIFSYINHNKTFKLAQKARLDR